MLKPKWATEHDTKGWLSMKVKGVKVSSLTLESGYSSLMRLGIACTVSSVSGLDLSSSEVTLGQNTQGTAYAITLRGKNG